MLSTSMKTLAIMERRSLNAFITRLSHRLRKLFPDIIDQLTEHQAVALISAFVDEAKSRELTFESTIFVYVVCRIMFNGTRRWEQFDRLFSDCLVDQSDRVLLAVEIGGIERHLRD